MEIRVQELVDEKVLRDLVVKGDHLRADLDDAAAFVRADDLLQKVVGEAKEPGNDIRVLIPLLQEDEELGVGDHRDDLRHRRHVHDVLRDAGAKAAELADLLPDLVHALRGIRPVGHSVELIHDKTRGP